MTAAEFLLACKVRGLSIADIDELNLGMIIDYIYDYDDINNIPENKENQHDSNVIMATQVDFDKF
jgi:hypothetical protein